MDREHLFFKDCPGWEANLGYFNLNLKVQVLTKDSKLDAIDSGFPLRNKEKVLLVGLRVHYFGTKSTIIIINKLSSHGLCHSSMNAS